MPQLTSLAMASMLSVAFASSASADDAHYAFELAVGAPTSTRDPFQIHLTETLVGAKPGVMVTVTYKVVMVEPDNQETVLLGPVTDSSSFGGGSGRSTIEYRPRQNGEFKFRVVRIEGNVETVLIERRVITDKALAVSLPSVPGTRPDGQFAITGIRTAPERPSVGQPVTIQIDAINSSTQVVSQTVPIVLSDDSGEQTLAIGSFTLDPGLSGTGEVSWVPDHVATGVLRAGDQAIPITIVDSTSATAPDDTNQSDSTDSPPEDTSTN
jgi:hypothetical protein